MAMNYVTWECARYGRPSHASQRPYWEPPVLDYRRYEEEGGTMYDSLHRHPDSVLDPSRWYEHTDVHIERDLAHEYLAWAQDRLHEAIETQNAERKEFYGGLFGTLYLEHCDAVEEHERNMDTMVDEIGDEEPPAEPGYEFMVAKVWDQEKKVIRRVITKFKVVCDPFKNTKTVYSDETGELVQVMQLCDDEEYPRMLRFVLEETNRQFQTTADRQAASTHTMTTSPLWLFKKVSHRTPAIFGLRTNFPSPKTSSNRQRSFEDLHGIWWRARRLEV